MRRPAAPALRTYALLVIGSLFTLGLAQAAWSLRLEILGTINTSDAAMSFVSAFTNDDGMVNDPNLDPDDTGNCPNGGRPDSSCDPVGQGPGRVNRDVARCSAAVEPGELLATVEMDQAYPAYHCTAWFVTRNTGNLPLRISALRLNGAPIETPSQSVIDLNGDQIPDLNLRLAGFELCQQLDPGQQATLELGQLLLGGAAPNTALEFTVELEFGQWNTTCQAISEVSEGEQPAP